MPPSCHRTQSTPATRSAAASALACLALVGCALPQTRDEMLSAASSPVRVCSSELTTAGAAERLEAAWQRCFVSPRTMGVAQTGSGAVFYEQSRLVVFRDRVGDATVLSTRIARRPLDLPTPLNQALFLMADIRETPECKSEVVVRAAAENWQKVAGATEKWLSDPLQQVPEAGCRR
ncbi:hypothetical protein Mpe_B0043 (plasmid) [Methylibium petroleiphilum PM1]|uniref:Lipoprotein n=2 Tax=Methylibium TaxID=316612 RepID=A2SMN4_METPP|nr:hypothetical protein Mpe_B0043 [Methylibium petroleiphilum PM1]